jgi:hypothetical protein
MGIGTDKMPVNRLYVSDAARLYGGPITRVVVDKTIDGFNVTIEGATEEYWLTKRVIKPAWYLPYANATTNQYDHYPHHTVWAYAGSSILRVLVAAHAGPAATGPTPADWPPPWWAPMAPNFTQEIFEKRLQPYSAIQWPLITFGTYDDGEGNIITTSADIRLKNGYDENRPFAFELFPNSVSPGHFFYNQYSVFAQQEPPKLEDGTELKWFADRPPINRQIFGLDLPDTDPMLGMSLIDAGGGVSSANPIRVSHRFESLLTALQNVAFDYGTLSFNLALQLENSQPKLMFNVWSCNESKDPRAEVKYRVELGEETATVNTYSVTTEYPTATGVILGGRGEGLLRTILDGWDLGAVETYEYLEVFKDATDTNDAEADALAYPKELVRELAENFRKDAVDGELQIHKLRYGIDFIVGDVVTVNLLGNQFYDTVLQATIRIDADTGETCSVRVGTPMNDAATKNPLERLFRSLSYMNRRVNRIERREATTSNNQVVPQGTQTLRETSYTAGETVIYNVIP